MSKHNSLKYKVFKIVEPGKSGASKVFDLFIIILISLNTLAVILESVESLNAEYITLFRVFEIISVVVFSIEYFFRVWTCTCRKEYSHPVFGRLKYVFSFMALVDLLAIVPFYFPFLIKADLRFLRTLRLFRVLRLAKLSRYSKSFKALKRVFLIKKEELAVSFFVGCLLLIISASLMYYAEKEAQPELFSSIPQSLWWSVCTLTTVGYGDMYPVTILGKIMASVISILGIGFLALPAGIFASGFYDYMAEEKEKKCPHCGKIINK